LVEIDPNSAASRAYYAAFHAVSALFLLNDKSFVKHKSIEAAVHRDLVLPGLWPKDRGADYSYLSRLRGVGDYGGSAYVTPDDASKAVDAADRIIETIRQMQPTIFIERDI